MVYRVCERFCEMSMSCDFMYVFYSTSFNISEWPSIGSERVPNPGISIYTDKSWDLKKKFFENGENRGMS